MNRALTDEQKDACLRVLYEGLIAIRMAAWHGDAALCDEIADALHNLPDLVRLGDEQGWSVEDFVRLFLGPREGEFIQAAAWREALLRTVRASEPG